MSTALKLNLDEVRSLLGLSTDSILNHVNKGTLSAGKVSNKGEDIYVFDFIEVKDFAKEYLDMSIDIPEKDEVEDEIEEEKVVIDKKSKKTKSAKENDDDRSAVSKILSNLQQSYETVLKQMSEYKEQAAFRIGQLEGELSSQRKLLASGQQELAEKERLIKKLKIELKKTRTDLEEEKQLLNKLSLWQRIWKRRD